MTADHRVQVDELLADYRRTRDQLASVHHRLATVSESATSPDGLVTATVGSGGTLTGLMIDDAAYRQHQPAALAALIVATTAKAAHRAAMIATEVVAPVLPAGTDPAALLAGTADLTPAELLPSPPVEDSFENQTWLEKR